MQEGEGHLRDGQGQGLQQQGRAGEHGWKEWRPSVTNLSGQTGNVLSPSCQPSPPFICASAVETSAALAAASWERSPPTCGTNLGSARGSPPAPPGPWCAPPGAGGGGAQVSQQAAWCWCAANAQARECAALICGRPVPPPCLKLVRRVAVVVQAAADAHALQALGLAREHLQRGRQRGWPNGCRPMDSHAHAPAVVHSPCW
jgi:hypothetical protein